MYTEEYQNNSSYQIDDEYDNNEQEYMENKESFFKKIGNFFHNSTGLIIKLAIIIICLGLLIWLIISLFNNKKINNTTINENIERIRLASEKYYFKKNNAPKNINEIVTITLKDMYDHNLIDKEIKYNNKVCDKNNTLISMKKENKHYLLSINLTCDSDNSINLFYYDLDNFKCLSCEDNNYNSDDEKENYDIEISCNKWSDWTDTIINNDELEVNKRTLVKGYKDTSTTQITYSAWTNYTTNVIVPTDNLEVEKVVKTEDIWSSNKFTTDYIKASDKIKIIDTKTTVNNYCSTGYSSKGSSCIKTKKLGDISLKELYNNQKIGDVSYDSVTTNENGVIYINAILTITKKMNSSSITTTTYQEKINTISTTYYRSRIKNTKVIKGEILYTDYVLEENLPKDYKKVDTLEKIEYSYKYKVCEK